MKYTYYMNHVVVLFANQPYFNKAYKTIKDIRHYGHYNGDLVFFHCGDLSARNEAKLKRLNVIVVEFDEIPIEDIIPDEYKAKMSHWSIKFSYNKLLIFHRYFKQWDRVFHVDAGMHVIKPIAPFFELNVTNQLMLSKEKGLIVRDYFNLDLSESLSKSLQKENDLNQQAGAVTLMYFDTCLIHDDTLNNIIDLIKKYPIPNVNEQAFTNLYFSCIKNSIAFFPERYQGGYYYTFHEKNYPGSRSADFILIKYPGTIGFRGFKYPWWKLISKKVLYYFRLYQYTR